MAVYWNFREILDLFPESSTFSCVGTTRAGKRCALKIEKHYERPAAGRLLDEMDRCKNLKSSCHYLDELAALTLCNRWHRQPGHSQLQSMTGRWRLMIKQYQREEELESMRGMENTVKAMKKKVKVLVEEQDELRRYKASFNRLGSYSRRPLTLAPQTSASKIIIPESKVLKKREPNIPMTNAGHNSQLSDPFTTEVKAESTNKRNFNNSLVSSGGPIKNDENPSFYRPLPASSTGEANHEQTKLSTVLLQHGLATPPETPESLIKGSQQEEDADGFALTPTKSAKGRNVEQPSSSMGTTSTNIMTASVLTNIDATKKQTISIRATNVEPVFTTTSKPSGACNESSVGTEERKPLPHSDLPFVTKDERRILKVEPSSKGQEITPVLPPAISEFNFGTQYNIPPKSFDVVESEDTSFTLQLTAQRTTIWDNPGPRVDSTADTDQPAAGNTKANSKIITTSITAATISRSTTNPPMTTNSHQNPAHQTTEETYGYAMVTPKSARYATYLPTAQRHGLLTPPAASDAMPQLEIYAGPFGNEFSGLGDRLAVVRKPLPVEVRQEVGASLAGACGDCAEGEVRAGCFYRFGLGRLREKVVGKLSGLNLRRSKQDSDEKKPYGNLGA
jgi:hypothetical protein